MTSRHWAEAYVGRPYVEGRHDCADFVADVLRERFGRALALPSRDSARATVRGRDRQIAALRGVHARRTTAPSEGDGVLMMAAGRGRGVGHHIGIWCAVSGEPFVLHCLKGTGSIFHPLRDLGRRALVLEGVYKWI